MRKQIWKAVLVMGAVAVSLHAQNTSGCWQTGWQSGQPVLVCDKPQYDPGGYQDLWTAISVSSSTLAWGSSWGAQNRESAERAAQQHCAKTGAKDCKVEMWGQNMCLALAVSVPEKSWGVDSDRNGLRAKAKALAWCQKSGGAHCTVPTWPCAHD